MPPGGSRELDVAINGSKGEDPEKIEADMGDVLGDFWAAPRARRTSMELRRRRGGVLQPRQRAVRLLGTFATPPVAGRDSGSAVGNRSNDPQPCHLVHPVALAPAPAADEHWAPDSSGNCPTRPDLPPLAPAITPTSARQVTSANAWGHRPAHASWAIRLVHGTRRHVEVRSERLRRCGERVVARQYASTARACNLRLASSNWSVSATPCGCGSCEGPTSKPITTS
jgi:hypothetical protein